MTRCLRHEVEDGVLCANHAEPLKLGAGIKAGHHLLIVGFLLVTELDVEQSQLVPFGACFAALKQVACLGRRTGHQCHSSRINDCYSQGIAPSPGLRQGDMTLPEG